MPDFVFKVLQYQEKKVLVRFSIYSFLGLGLVN